MLRLKEGSIELSKFNIDYIAFGKGERPLIMIQGLNTNGIKGAGLGLALMYRIFAKSHRVYLFDRRADVSSGITVREMAQDVAEAMDMLELRDADILGVSEGGMIAQYLAIERPDLVHRMVLALTVCRNNDTVEKAIDKWVQLSEKEDYKALVCDMAERMYSEKYLKAYRPLLPLLTMAQKPKDKERFITLAKSCLSCNTYDNLYKIKCPTLVIGAREDKVVGVNGSIELAEKIGCELYIYEHLGHAAYEEAPDFNRRVLDFFNEGK